MVVDQYGLSPMQHGMLFHHLSAPHSGIDIQQIVISYCKPTDATALERAWQAAVEKYLALRTSFRWEGLKEPVQQVHDEIPIQLERHESCDEATFSAFLDADRRRGFDLSQPPLLRLTLFESGTGSMRLVWTVHHILVDGRACVIILNEVERIYDCLLSGTPLDRSQGLSYKPYIEWIKELDLSSANEFWGKRLQGLSAPTTLPLDPGGPPKETSIHGEIEIALSETLTSRLRNVAAECKVGLNTIVMASWAILLGRFGGETDILFGAVRTTRGKSIPYADSIVGLFLNTVPVRVAVDPGTQVAQMLKLLYAEWTWVNLRHYDHTPLVQIKRASSFPNSEPLFNSLVVFENQTFHTSLVNSQQRWRQRDFTFHEQTGLPLALSAFGDEAMLLRMEYDASRYDRAIAALIVAHLAQIIESIADNPHETIGNLKVIPPDEHHKLLVEFNSTEHPYPKETPLASLIEEQVRRTPDAIAVVYGEQKISYQELNNQANQLAHELRKLRVGPDQVVGLLVERSIGMVIALVAIVKAGATYLPLDPRHPSERLCHMLKDSGVRVLVTEQSLRDELPMFPGQRILLEDDCWRKNAGDKLVVDVRPEHLAYSIYTSGSTGKPKGVQVPRGALTNLLCSMREWSQLSERDRVLAITTISFDMAVPDIWLPLIVGAQMVIASRTQASDGIALRSLLESHNITFMQATPITWRLLFDAGHWDGKRDLQAVCGGEAMPPELAARLAPVVKKLWNLYGPTETTVWSTRYLVEAGHKSVLIGRPLANTRCYILDPQGQPVPLGATGELYIGGDGLALGYLNRPELTAEKFLVDPFRGGGARMYRTGDLARYHIDGNIECLGRIDHQIKLHGHRIEPGEIEAALKEQPEIREAVVVARDNEPGERLLVAYLVANDGSVPAASELRRRLKQRLPDYMLPTAYLFLDEIPISPTGKIDRKSLPAPSECHARSVPVGTHVPPRNHVEETLARIWAETLAVERVGIHDDFFEMGGDSLDAVRLVVNITSAYPACQPPLATLMKAPTVAQFASALSSGQADWSCLVAVREGNERPPFFCVHGAGGNVLSMRDLAMALPSTLPFYCLQARGLDGHAAPFYSVEETAECYVAQIRRVQPHGPYYLGGGCYGGLVAFEMARHLRSMGEAVSVLALIETWNFSYGRLLSKPKLLYLNSRFFLRRIFHHMKILRSLRPQDWTSHVSGPLVTFMKLSKSLVRIAGGREETQFPVNLVDAQHFEDHGDLGDVLERVRNASHVAARNFIPKPYDGHLLVFSAKTRIDDPYRDEALGWRPLALRGVTAHKIDGDHLSIFRKPAVGVIAEKLEEAISAGSASARGTPQSTAPTRQNSLVTK